MPFDSGFDDTYELGVKQSCIDAGAYCERVDEQFFHEPILDRIYNQISKADVVIADMTGRNPNVFYEVGYAHALGKTTILLTQDANDIPFDLKPYPHIIYDKKILKLKEELTQKLKWCIGSKVRDASDLKIDIDMHLGKQNLMIDKVTFEVPRGDWNFVNLTLYNKSLETFSSKDFRLGVITEVSLGSLFGGLTTHMELPDGRFLQMKNDFNQVLYPNSYASLELDFGEAAYNFELSGEHKLVFRLFTAHGIRDYEAVANYGEKANSLETFV